MGNRTGIYGVGINDSDYSVRESYWDGKKRHITWECPIFVSWKDMMKRVYSESYHKKRPTYIGCTVAEEWLSFMKFREWAGSDTSLIGIEGNKLNLDKDIVLEGNKHYCPEYCNFVEPKINNFIPSNKYVKGYPTGISLDIPTNRLWVFCVDPFKVKSNSLGGVDTVEEGLHLYYKTKRGYLRDLLSRGYTDERMYKIIDDRLINDLNKELCKLKEVQYEII